MPTRARDRGCDPRRRGEDQRRDLLRAGAQCRRLPADAGRLGGGARADRPAAADLSDRMGGRRRSMRSSWSPSRSRRSACRSRRCASASCRGARKRERAHAAAMRQFLAQGMQKTEGRTGVLIFAARGGTLCRDHRGRRHQRQGDAGGVGCGGRVADRGDQGRPRRRRLRGGDRAMRRGAGASTFRSRRARSIRTSCRTSWWRFEFRTARSPDCAQRSEA